MRRLLVITLMMTLLAGSVVPVFGDDVIVGADIGKSLSVTFNYTTVDFGTLFSGTSNNTMGGLLYNVTVETNYDWLVKANGTDFDDGSGHTFDIGNMTVDAKVNSGSLDACNGLQLTSSPAQVESGTNTGTFANYHEYCLDIPTDQYANVYNSTVTWTYENQ